MNIIYSYIECTILGGNKKEPSLKIVEYNLQT